MLTRWSGPSRPARPGVRATALGAFAAVVLAACASPAPGPAGSTSTTAARAPSMTAPATSTAPAPAPSATETEQAGPFPSPVATATADPSSGAALTVTGVRAAAHDGYDRVVLDLGGTGAPGWRVGYVDKAVDDPSGQPVQVQGAGILQVIITGTGYPTDTGQTEWHGSPLHPGLPVVQEVQLRGVFEGQTQAFLGVARAGAPFRVFALTAPARLVIDVQR